MRTPTLGLAALLVVGCSSGTTITVGADTFTVRDQGYYYSDSHDFCANGGAGQMMLDFVDYDFICDPTHTPDRAPGSPHVELRIILTQGPLPDHLTHPNMGLPYDSTPGVTPDCNAANGSGDTIIGEIVHYPDGNAGTMPDRIEYANSAHLQFTFYDPTKAKPNQGNYDLKFGGSEIKHSFTIAACN